MDEQTRAQLSPGTRVKVTQQIAGRYYAWPTEIVGTVVSYERRPDRKLVRAFEKMTSSGSTA